MPKAVRSAKGAEVNFDMLRIKAQIASAPKPTIVKAREDFIDQKFKRRLKRMKREVVHQMAEITVGTKAPVDKTENNDKDTDTKTEE